MRGRKPKPTAIKLLSGNPGKRPLPKNELKPPPEVPRPPSILQGLARKEWKRIAPLLYDAGLLTKIDATMLAAYCQVYARWCEAEIEIRRTGTVIKSSKGQPMVSPFLKVANISLQQMTRMLAEFGMSPSSRSRVTVAEIAKEDDPFEIWLHKRDNLKQFRPSKPKK